MKFSLVLSLSALCLVLTINGCGGGKVNYVYKGTEQKTDTVKINNCVASPDSVAVPKQTNLHWVVDSSDPATYTINFTNDNPIDGAIPKTSTNLPDPPHQVHGHWPCYSALDYCGSFPYTLTQTISGQSTVCPDPGVHVTPN